MKFNTRLIHGEFNSETKTGATTVPIYQSSSFAHGSAEELESIFRGNEYGYIYTRINNPTIESFERRIAHLEKGVGAAACSSGMSAIGLTFLSILKAGDEVVAGSGVFGGTFSLLENLKKFGITANYAESNEVEVYRAKITEKTRVIFVETIGNPKMDVADIAGLATLAHEHGVPLVVDNTVTTPYLLNPVELGADIVIHSTSKFINGSGNSIGGIIVDSGRFNWPEEKFPDFVPYRKKFRHFAFLARLRKELHRDLGCCISPFNAYLNSLGLETLGIRMEVHCNNALALAEKLSQHKRVSWVNYPGLSDSPYRELAAKQFAGKFGAILTFGVGSKAKAFKLINNLKLAYNLANIGDTRTLVIHPASTIYLNNTLEERALMGVREDLIRVSVGLEDIEDIIVDFENALESLG